VITKVIARFWLCKLSKNEAKVIQKPFRDRLINEFISYVDRGTNELASHFQKVADYLTEHTTSHPRQCFQTTNRSEWVDVIRHTFSLCGFGNSNGHPLREHSCRTGEPDTIPPSAFLVASMTGHTDVEASMIQAGHCPKHHCIYLQSPFQTVCRLGDVAAVQRLLHVGVIDSTNQYRSEELSALYDAASWDYSVVIKLLAPKYSLSNIKTAAHYALRSNSWEVFACIIEHYPLAGCDKSAAGGGSLLFELVERGSINVVESFGLAWDLQDLQSPRKLALAAATGGNIDLLKSLVQRGLRFHLKSVKGFMFVISAMKGHVAMLEHCIAHKYHMKHSDPPSLQTYALFAAIANQRAGTVETLVNLLALDPNTIITHDDGTETTPLRIAVDTGSVEMVHLLIKLGASPHQSGNETVGLSEQDRERCKDLIVDEWRCQLALRSRHMFWQYKARHLKVENALRVLIDSRKAER
jgi:hypothetical protein